MDEPYELIFLLLLIGAYWRDFPELVPTTARMMIYCLDFRKGHCGYWHLRRRPRSPIRQEPSGLGCTRVPRSWLENLFGYNGMSL